MTAKEAEALLLKAGFKHTHGEGAHRLYKKGRRRVMLTFHAGKDLHPKTVKQVMIAISDK